MSKDGEQHRKCNYELPNYLYQLNYTGNAFVETMKVVHRTQPKSNGSGATLLTKKRYHYLQDYLNGRQAYRLQLLTLQTPSLTERKNSLLQQAVLQCRLGVILSDNGRRNNAELKHIFQYRSFVHHYVTIVTDIHLVSIKTNDNPMAKHADKKQCPA